MVSEAVGVRAGQTSITLPSLTSKGNQESNSEDMFIGLLGEIIFESEDPETAFLEAIIADRVPEDLIQQLADAVRDFIADGGVETKVLDLDNSQMAIPQVHAEAAPTVLIPTAIQESESMAVTAVQAVVEPPKPDKFTELVRRTSEAHSRFGAELPESERSEIRSLTNALTEDEFKSLRQILGSAILAEVEKSVEGRTLDTSSALAVITTIFGQRQADLTAATATVYETLRHGGFRLTLRDDFNRPVMSVSSLALLRTRIRSWLADNTDEKLFQAAECLEGFLLAAADQRVKAAIQRDAGDRIRDRIIISWSRVIDAVNAELVSAQPATKEQVLRNLQTDLGTRRVQLVSLLRTIESVPLCQAEATISKMLDLKSSISALRGQMVEIEANGYTPALAPTLSVFEKRLVFFEIERAELVAIRGDLQGLINSGQHVQKALILLVLTGRKISELETIIAGMKPAAAQEVAHV